MKNLKLSYNEVIYLINKLNYTLSEARTESKIIIKALNNTVQNSHSVKDKMELLNTDLQFMSERADKKVKNIDNFRELLFTMAR